MTTLNDLSSLFTNPQAPVTPSAPSGGAILPSAQPQLGGGSSPPSEQPPAQPAAPQSGRSLVEAYERAGHINPGQFRNDVELTHRLFEVTNELATELERSKSTPSQPAAPVQPVQPAAPTVDLNKVANAFQQQGLLKFESGQWVSSHPMAAQVATELNQAVLAAQARQAELADPTAFIAKYGESAIKSHMTPLEQQFQALKSQYETLQSQMQALTPSPYKSWIDSNKEKLYALDAVGTKQLTPAGKAYHDAWEALKDRVDDESVLHDMARRAAEPLLQVTPAQPQQTFLEKVASTPVQPGFTLPGTTQPATGQPVPGISTDNKGFPDFQKLMTQHLSGM